MNKYEQRDIDAKKGYCCGNAWSWLKLALSDKEIKKKIKNMEIGLNDVDGVKNDLKQEVYFKHVENTKKSLENHLYNLNEKHITQFKRLFWEEYLYESEFQYYNTFSKMPTFKEIATNTKNMNKIKDFLDKNPELHNITGGSYQQTPLYDTISKITKGMTFSMRAWGALMAAYMNSKKKKRLYDYMSYYM